MRKIWAVLCLFIAVLIFPVLARATNNAGDFGSGNGGVAIGAGYANTYNAPSNGLIVQGNVGIGTTTSSSSLSLVGSSSNQIELYATDPSGGYMLLENQNVGGGGSPTLLLRAGSGSTAGAYISMEGKLESAVSLVATSNTSGQRVMSFSNGSNVCTNCFSILALNDSATVITAIPFMLANSAPTNSLNINASGNVGIGTSVAQSRVHAYGAEVQVGSSGASCSSLRGGAIRFNSGSLYYCDGSSTWQSIGAGSLPSLASANIWVGNGSNVATAVTMAGDCLINNAGSILCTKTNGVSFGALATASSVNLSTQASGTLQATQFPALTGDVTTTSGSFATTVAKIQGTTVSGTTGTGNAVFSASPTVTGTVTGASANWSGSVGIGTASPQSAVHAYNGEVQIGSSGASCSSTNSGAMRYSSGTFYGCNGTSWQQLSGGYVFISTVNASNVSSVTFTNMPSYNQCEVRLTNVVADTSNAMLQVQGSEDNGSTWLNSNYAYAGTIVNYQGSTNYNTANPASSVVLSGIRQYNAQMGASGTVTVYGLSNSSIYKVFNYAISASDNDHGAVQSLGVGTGEYFGDTGVFNALKFSFSSGNITSGAFSLYCLN